jgi:hypothetical protein
MKDIKTTKLSWQEIFKATKGCVKTLKQYVFILSFLVNIVYILI